MSPPDRRRRRVRPLHVVVVLAVLLAVVALIGGLSEVGSESGLYWRSVDRSYAAQGAVLVDQSNQSCTSLRQLLASWSGQSRRSVEAALDVLVRTTARTSMAAASLSRPAPWGDLDAEFTGALSDRARAMADLRSAVDGLLGMAPLPVSTAGGSTSGGSTAEPVDAANGRVQLTAAQAASALSNAGALLEKSDRVYAQARHAFGRAPGSPHLPASRWVSDPATWAAGPTLTLADQLAGAPQLAPAQQVVLLPSAVSITPAPVPSVPGGTSLLPPTRSVIITVVVADDGNVAESGVPVSATITEVGRGTTVRRTSSVSLAAGASRAVRLPSLPVRPAQHYELVVTLTPPTGEPAGSVTSLSYSVDVAPSASPPPTTTTTTTQPSKHSTTTTTPAGKATTTTTAPTTTTTTKGAKGATTTTKGAKTAG